MHPNRNSILHGLFLAALAASVTASAGAQSTDLSSTNSLFGDQVRTGGIETGALAAIDPSAIGLLDKSNGGLPANLWSDSDKAAVQALIPLLPMSSASPAMNRLARRVILSRGAAPNGPGVSGTSLLCLKLQRLMAAGDLEALAGLVPLVSRPEVDPDAGRVLVDALLLLGRVADAGSLAEKIARQSADPYFLKTQILAQVSAGDESRIDLAMDLLAETGSDDKIFASNIDFWRKHGKSKAKVE